jgi:hypothetical protein
MNRTNVLIALAGFILLVFGLGCLNYTKIGGIQYHTEVAERNGWPPPSVAIAHLGMLATPIGAATLGFAAGRRKRV